jgi:hypothetical protein
MQSRLLPQHEILSLRGAVISAGLAGSSMALLTGVNETFVAGLPIVITPGEQVLIHLDAMNAAGILTDGSFPLALWLRNAIGPAGPRAEAVLFDEVLERLERRVEDAARANKHRESKHALQAWATDRPTWPADQSRVIARLPPLLVGDLYMDRFFVSAIAGHGGFSDAYIAWDLLRGQEVVIKLVAIESQSASVRCIVERELDMSRRLSVVIPDLVQILDVLRFEGGACIVQSRVLGEDVLRRLMLRTIFPEQEALRVAISICDALDSLHVKRVAHCDVKPANIIVRPAAPPVLIDLGSARFFDEEILSAHAVVSRPYSHEMLITGKRVDGRVDVYSLAVTLLHMLTGIPAWVRGSSFMPRLVCATTSPPQHPMSILDRLEREKSDLDGFSVALDLVSSLKLRRALAGALGLRKTRAIVTAAEFKKILVSCNGS